MARNDGIRIELVNETAISKDEAEVRVYLGDVLVGKVAATVALMQGADGGLYHCVRLEGRRIAREGTGAGAVIETVAN